MRDGEGFLQAILPNQIQFKEQQQACKYSLVAMIMATTLLSMGTVAVGAWDCASPASDISGDVCLELSSTLVAP